MNKKYLQLGLLLLLVGMILLPIASAENTSISNNAITNPLEKHVAEPYHVDIANYITWNFAPYYYISSLFGSQGRLDLGYTDTLDNIGSNSYPPYGYSFVRVTIHMKNTGDKPLSADPGDWTFISDGVRYSYDYLLQMAEKNHPNFKVNPGQGGKFNVDYFVKGAPTTGSIEYHNPYIDL